MYLVVVACLGAAVPGPYFFGDLFCGVAEGDQLFAARQHNRIEKRLIPCHLDQSQRRLTTRTESLYWPDQIADEVFEVGLIDIGFRKLRNRFKGNLACHSCMEKFGWGHEQCNPQQASAPVWLRGHLPR